jgi:hypothetical protein
VKIARASDRWHLVTQVEPVVVKSIKHQVLL